MVFFLNLCFHVVVADHTSLLMCAWEFLYMAYMLVNYALFIFRVSTLEHLFSVLFRGGVVFLQVFEHIEVAQSANRLQFLPP